MIEQNLVTFTVNGEEVEGPAGANLLQWCLDNDRFVPHYCYHPGLSVAANCRMCLVKTSTSRKPEPSCNLKITPEMVIETNTPEVKEMQEDVMEFLLINHPLDCPTCDQSGECKLQDFAFDHGRDHSRFVEEKHQKYTAEFGPLVKYYGDRCIACTRCVRFCDEVTGTGELAMGERGGHSEVITFPGNPLANDLSGNTIDICPVGALLSRDFLFQARVWFLAEADTICTSCSKGCNIKVDRLKGGVKRIRPRTNADVNEFWMCDHGRLNYRYLESGDRLVDWRWADGAETDRETAESRADRLKQLMASDVASGSVGVLVSPYLTNEELFLIKELCDNAWNPVAVGMLPGETWDARSFPKFEIPEDKSPNRSGVAAIFGAETTSTGSVFEALESGKVKTVVVFNHSEPREFNADLLGHLGKASQLIVSDILKGGLTDNAQVVIPAAAWIEVDGTMVNGTGRVQRLTRGIDPPGSAIAGFEFLQTLLKVYEQWDTSISAEGVFRKLAESVQAFAGMDFGTLQAQGQQLGAGAEPVAAATESEG